MPNQHEQDLFGALSKAFNEKTITPSEAKRIFDRVEEQHKAFQKQLQASIPSQSDRQRVYNL